MGAVVHKNDPEGEFMTLGARYHGQDQYTFNPPSSVIVAENGDIFVADGEGPNNRIVKYAANGITFWNGERRVRTENSDTP
ncbi:MAG: hypothetical protein Ct9H300mP19_16280 [Dehalococcoidia bacterium]|nr:MAG: hypothetical protein Ct9H300mP19_16280 [Dehalococcoidia bacterium]